MAASQQQLQKFYSIIDHLRSSAKSVVLLGNIAALETLPECGVYFLLDPREKRSYDHSKPRVVRVGTHMVTGNSQRTLAARLKTHATGSINGSILRGHVSRAIDRRDLVNNTDSKQAVTDYVSVLEVVALPVRKEDKHLRKMVEQNSIGLLSESEKPSDNWLGRYSDRLCIRHSFLWNIDHVDHEVENDFLEKLHLMVAAI